MFQNIVRWGQEEKKDIVKLFSIVSEIEYDKLYNLRDSEFEDKLFQATRFVGTDPNYSKSPLRSIRLKDRVGYKTAVLIPKRTAALSIGQSILVRQKLDECKVYEEAMSYACAIYLQPLLDRTVFDIDRAMIIEKQILKMPAKEIYPLGFFLLSPLMKTGGSFMKEVSRIFRQGWNSFITRGRQLVRLQKSTGLNPSRT